MMKNNCLLLCATALSSLCFYTQANASINFNSEIPPILNVADRHTQHTPNLSARSLSSPFSKEREFKVAQVCFITDTEDCGGADFVGTDGTQGTPPIEVLPPKKESCIKMGYGKTACPQDYKPNKYCPLNSTYFAECIPDCPSDYKTCEAPLQGIGTVCAGNMYEDCCTNTCGDEYKYDASNLPAGYELVGEPCMACEDGGSRAKYKDIEEKDCTGFVDCGLSGCKAGTPTCQNGSQIKCSECEPCPNLGTESECPPCTVCTFEECSNLYIVTGCKTGCTDYCDFCAFEQ